jgi:endonuclease/exonuclease/phosphatase (EEP) superfamily protein YafD
MTPPPVDAQTDTTGRHSSNLRRFFLPTWRQRQRMLRRDAWLIILVTYALLALAYAWPQNFRTDSYVYNLVAYGLFQVRTFLWHIGLVVLLAAALAAWQRAWLLAIAAVPLLALTLGPELRHFAPKRPVPPGDPVITVMSVNLLYLNHLTGPILDEVRRADPDVLLLQEYTSDWHMAITAARAARYSHIRQIRRPDPFGAAIYSRLPFVGDVETDLRLANVDTPQMRAVVGIGGREVAVYNVHLVPPYGVRLAALTRRQLADLYDRLAADPLPIILSGDFNFTERSTNAGLLHSLGLVDVHDLTGFGRGVTWPVNSFFRYMPGIRLDHIYLGRALTCTESRIGTGRGSDHRPIVAKVGFAR